MNCISKLQRYELHQRNSPTNLLGCWFTSHVEATSSTRAVRTWFAPRARWHFVGASRRPGCRGMGGGGSANGSANGDQMGITWGHFFTNGDWWSFHWRNINGCTTKKSFSWASNSALVKRPVWLWGCSTIWSLRWRHSLNMRCCSQLHDLYINKRYVKWGFRPKTRSYRKNITSYHHIMRLHMSRYQSYNHDDTASKQNVTYPKIMKL